MNRQTASLAVTERRSWPYNKELVVVTNQGKQVFGYSDKARGWQSKFGIYPQNYPRNDTRNQRSHDRDHPTWFLKWYISLSALTSQLTNHQSELIDKSVSAHLCVTIGDTSMSTSCIPLPQLLLPSSDLILMLPSLRSQRRFFHKILKIFIKMQPKNVFVTSRIPFSFPSRNPDLHGISQLIESDLRYIIRPSPGWTLINVVSKALFHMYPCVKD